MTKEQNDNTSIRILQDNRRLFESSEAYILDKKLEETFKLGKVY